MTAAVCKRSPQNVGGKTEGAVCHVEAGLTVADHCAARLAGRGSVDWGEAGAETYRAEGVVAADHAVRYELVALAAGVITVCGIIRLALSTNRGVGTQLAERDRHRTSHALMARVETVGIISTGNTVRLIQAEAALDHRSGTT